MTEKKWSSVIRQLKVMSEKNQVTTQGRRDVEVAILLLNNDKNVTAENELSYF